MKAQKAGLHATSAQLAGGDQGWGKGGGEGDGREGRNGEGGRGRKRVEEGMQFP